MIEVVRYELGYCHQCLNACTVGVFRVKGWKHLFCLCSVCIEGLARGVVGSSYEVVKEDR